MTAGVRTAIRIVAPRRGALRTWLGTADARLIIAWGVIPALVLFLVPLVFWTGVTGERASVGGDASLLFFNYPAAWLHNSSTTLASPGLGGYNAQTQFVPLVTVIRLLRGLGLNAEGVLFGATLASGYLGVRWIVLELFGRTERFVQPAAALAGVLYLSLPINSEIIWASPLPRLFWIALLPLFMGCLLAHQRSGLRRYAIGAIVATVLLAPAFTDFPGTIPAVILAVLLLLAAWSFGATPFRSLRAVGFFTWVGAANLFWLIPTAMSFNQGSQVLDATSTNGKQAATALITSLGPQQQITSALELRQSHRMMIINNWVQLHVDGWSGHLWFLGLIPLVLLLTAAIIGRLRNALFATLAVVSFLLLCAQSTGSLPFTQSIYVFLTDHVPGWTAERNFFGTWPVAVSLAVALTTGASFMRIGAHVGQEEHHQMEPAPTEEHPSWIWRTLGSRPAAAAAVSLSVLMVVYNAPLYLGRVFRLDYTSGIAVPRALDALPANYKNAVHFIEQQPSGDVMTVPLLSPAWTIVPRGQTQGYVGLSPINYLTNRADYNGLDSFGSGTDVSNAVRTAVTDDNTNGLARVAGTLGVRYVLVDTDLMHSSLYGLGAAPTDEAEQEETSALLLDDASQVLAAFGPWQVRALDPTIARAPLAGTSFPLNASYATPLAGLANLASTTAAGKRGKAVGRATCDNLDVSGSPEHSLVVHVLGTLPHCALVLNRPYSTNWQARLTTPAGTQSLVVGRGNVDLTAFALPQETVAGSTVRITFAPNSRLALWGYLSLALTVLCGLLGEVTRRGRWDICHD